jgi:chitinase
MKRSISIPLLVLLVASSLSLKAQQIWVNTWYASWQQGYHDQQGHCTSDKVDFTAMTHVTHFYVGMNGDVSGANGGLPGVWFNNFTDSYGMDSTTTTSTIARAHATGTKITFCISGGHTEFSAATSDQNRAGFINNIMWFLRTRGYDGVDIDWEATQPSDTVGFRKLVNQLYDSLGTISPRPLLTEAAPPGPPYLCQYVWQKLDQINIMTYDLPNGAWNGWVTWPDCSIYSRDSLGNPYNLPSTGAPCPGAIDVVVDGFHSAGIPYSKLGIASDWYLYDWVGGVMQDGNGVLRPRETWVTPPGVYGGSNGAEYFHFMQGNTISSIPQGVNTPGLHRIWDAGLQVPYWTVNNSGTANDHMVSLDDQQAIRAKIDYAKQKGLGGIAVWEIGAGYRDDLPTGARDSMLQSLKYALSASNNWIYDDNLNSPWAVRNVTYDAHNTEHVYSGNYSFKATVPQWGGPVFASGGGSALYLNPNSYSAVEFYIYVSGSDGQLSVELANDSASAIGYWPNGNPNPITVTANQWNKITYPMSVFLYNVNGNPITAGHTFNTLNLGESASGGRTWYLDQIRLVGTLSSVEQHIDGAEVVFALAQNFPNPFNPSTKIQFDLPGPSMVTLRVINILGEEVATLVAGRLAGGRHEVEWHASGLASGLYVYELRMGNMVVTKKMLLLR